jgi:hypothetical protein
VFRRYEGNRKQKKGRDNSKTKEGSKKETKTKFRRKEMEE